MKRSTEFSTDELMWKTASALLRDFQATLQDDAFCCELYAVFNRRDVTALREWSTGGNAETDPYRFKVRYQMQNLFKRYRFSKDLYTDSELTIAAINGFVETQKRLALVDFEKLSTLEGHILDVAAKYIAKVLGDYSDEEHRSLCRFGKKASVGVPSRTACEADRWQLPVTGSAQQILWFDEEIRHVDCVQNYWQDQSRSDPQGSTYKEIECLKLALVPKTYKSLRSIMPNTTIGSYMSYGIGEMMTRRLRKAGYNIRKLQHVHRELARSASIDGNSVTMDLSSASDSITEQLVKRLLPADWFEILERSRIQSVQLPDGQTVVSQTYCTMGIGYTFPLQTLIFLSLLKAISRVLYWNKPAQISVYGDDMIFSSYLYPAVSIFFPKVGFVINFDKTFDEGDFRESCGGDYFRGVDVRPFQPRNDQAHVGKLAYEATVYKYINGLLRRWTEHEICGTLNVLLSELARVTRGPKLVPGDFPDDSGIRCQTLECWSFLTNVSAERPKRVGHGIYRFSYLRFKSKLRKETRHEPYLWVALSSGLVGQSDRLVYHHLQESTPTPLLTLITSVVGIRDAPGHLIWQEEPTTTTRSKLTGQRLRKLAAYTVLHGDGCYTRQSGTSCFDGRS